VVRNVSTMEGGVMGDRGPPQHLFTRFIRRAAMSQWIWWFWRLLSADPVVPMAIAVEESGGAVLSDLSF